MIVEVILSLLISLMVWQIFASILTFFIPIHLKNETRISKNRIDLKLKNTSKFDFSWSITARIQLENLYTNEKTELKIKRTSSLNGFISLVIDVKNSTCGLLNVEIFDVKISRFDSIFGRKIQIATSEPCLIMPEVLPEILNFELSDSNIFSQKKGNGLRDGVREYQSGDSMRDIHMKLSAKAGKYMVSERPNGGEGVLNIIFCYSGDADISQKNASLLLTLMYDCFAKGGECAVKIGEGIVKVQGEWDVQSTFLKLFSNDRKSFSSRSANDFDGILIENGEVHMT